jgi:hypothetical protein
MRQRHHGDCTGPSTHARRILAIGIAGLVLAAGCSAAGGAGSSEPSIATDVTPSAAPAARYPGWPGDGSVTTTGDMVPILVSSEVAVGRDRFLFSLADPDNKLLASPDLPVHLRFFDLAVDPQKPELEADGRFIWAVPDQRGLYEAIVDFPQAGDWGVEVVATPKGGSPQAVRVTFPVRQQSQTPAIGAAAPLSDTPVLGPGIDIATISSDAHPDPAFYRLSVKQAIAAHEPFVLVFATPKFCTSQVCGPTLDTVKSVSTAFTGKVNFIHVEVYTNLSDAAHLQLVPSVTEWGLPSEPWVFVVDADGKVADKFEGAVSADDLKATLDALVK